MNPPYFVTCDIKDAYRVGWSLYKNEDQYPIENNTKMMFKVVENPERFRNGNCYTNFIGEFNNMKKYNIPSLECINPPM